MNTLFKNIKLNNKYNNFAFFNNIQTEIKLKKIHNLKLNHTKKIIIDNTLPINQNFEIIINIDKDCQKEAIQPNNKIVLDIVGYLQSDISKNFRASILYQHMINNEFMHLDHYFSKLSKCGKVPHRSEFNHETNRKLSLSNKTESDYMFFLRECYYYLILNYHSNIIHQILYCCTSYKYDHNNDDLTAIFVAAIDTQNLPILRRLIYTGFNIYHTGSNFCTIMDYIIDNNKTQVFEMLLLAPSFRLDLATKIKICQPENINILKCYLNQLYISDSLICILIGCCELSNIDGIKMILNPSPIIPSQKIINRKNIIMKYKECIIGRIGNFDQSVIKLLLDFGFVPSQKLFNIVVFNKQHNLINTMMTMGYIPSNDLIIDTIKKLDLKTIGIFIKQTLIIKYNVSLGNIMLVLFPVSQLILQLTIVHIMLQ